MQQKEDDGRSTVLSTAVTAKVSTQKFDGVQAGTNECVYCFKRVEEKIWDHVAGCKLKHQKEKEDREINPVEQDAQ